MKRILSIFIALSLLSLSGCGPIIGQLMRASEGVKDFKVIHGNLGQLQVGSNLLVVGPFAKAPGAYYFSRGDDAAAFPEAINKTGLFKTELYVGLKFTDGDKLSSLRHMSGKQLSQELSLTNVPDYIMYGTILERDTIVAPTRGIIMRVGYRLEFLNLADKSSVVVEVTVKEPFRDCITTVATEIAKQTNAAK